jgi:hypothetical protein
MNDLKSAFSLKRRRHFLCVSAMTLTIVDESIIKFDQIKVTHTLCRFIAKNSSANFLDNNHAVYHS